MKVAEILTEMRIGRVSPSVSTIDRSTPWVKKGMKVASDRTRTFNQLNTATEKFEFLHKETEGFTIKKNIRVAFLVNNRLLPFKKFNPSTGELILRDPRTSDGKNITVFKHNISDFEFDRREKSPSQTTLFVFRSEKVGEKTVEKNPNFDPSKHKGSRQASGTIGKTSSDFKKRATDPFSEPAGEFKNKANNPFGI